MLEDKPWRCEILFVELHNVDAACLDINAEIGKPSYFKCYVSDVWLFPAEQRAALCIKKQGYHQGTDNKLNDKWKVR